MSDFFLMIQNNLNINIFTNTVQSIISAEKSRQTTLTNNEGILDNISFFLCILSIHSGIYTASKVLWMICTRTYLMFFFFFMVIII